MRLRKSIVAFLLLFVSLPCFGGDTFQYIRPWWNSGLTFYAPFDDPSNPLRLLKGTGSLSFTRATTATYVHPTTGLITSAASGQLRIESNGALIEGQRTNLALQSDNLAATGWNGDDGVSARTVSDNAVSPDGTLNADKLVEGTGSSTHIIYNDNSALVDSTVYTHSVFLKAAERSFAFVTINMMTYVVSVNLSTGAVAVAYGSIPVAYSSTSYGNGWWRVSITGTWGAGSTGNYIYISKDGVWANRTFAGDNASGLYVWGAQLEAASFPSSYIPTTTAAVTRNADILTAPWSGNFNQEAGTVATSSDVLGTEPFLQYIVGTNDGYISATPGSMSIRDGLNTLTKGSLSLSTSKPVAVAWGGSTQKICVSAGAISSGAFDGGFGGGTTAYIGDSGSAVRLLFGHIRSFRVWNRKFSDIELQNITTQ